jgi:toxin ParE1/3/4
MRIEWSALALEDRLAIFDYIEADSPGAAVRIDEHIRGEVKRLKQFPEIGRPGRIEGTRELLIAHTPYIAAYRVAGKIIVILRILHGARQWPDKMTGG